MSTPRFTVVIPTYRRNESLGRCLTRLTPDRQELPCDQFEVVVTDDGSPSDNARSLVTKTYPRVRWVQGPQRGPAANRNYGARQASGQWLIFTDDDCLPRPDWLAAFAARLAISPTPRVLEGRTDNGGETNAGPFRMTPGNDVGGLLWSCNFAIERQLFETMGGFDEAFPYPHLEDVDLRLRLEDRGENYEFVPAACVDHPPRPVGSALRWVKTQESSFYLARKRGVTLAGVNFGVGMYLRSCMQSFRLARNVGELLRVAVRIVQETILMAWFIPRWLVRYRAGVQPAAASNFPSGSPT